MSYWYWRKLKEDWEVEEGKDNKFDLPSKGHISGLAVQLYTDNEADLSIIEDPFIIQRITKQRIVGNGNINVINCRARELQAMNFWEWGTQPIGRYSQQDQITQRNFWNIPFGRWMGDLDYGLILDNFKSGTEWIDTNNISTTYHGDTDTHYNIWALMRKQPEANLFSKGFLKKRTVVTEAATTATQNEIKLPTDAKLRQIYLFSEPDESSGADSTAAQTLVKYLFLSVKSKDEYLIDNMRVRDYCQAIHNKAGRIAETLVDGLAYAANSYEVYHDTMIYRGFQNVASCGHGSTADGSVVMDAAADTRKVRCWPLVAGSGSNVYSYLYRRGHMMHGQLPLLFQHDINDEREWLDSRALGDIYVGCTEGSSSGDWYVTLDELETQYER